MDNSNIDWDSELSRYRKTPGQRGSLSHQNPPPTIIRTTQVSTIHEVDDDDEVSEMPERHDETVSFENHSDDDSEAWDRCEWMEFQSVENPNMRVFYNPKRNKVSMTKPFGVNNDFRSDRNSMLSDTWSDDEAVGNNEATYSAPNVTDSRERAKDRCHDSMDVISHQTELCLLQANMISREFQDALLVMKNAIQKARSALDIVVGTADNKESSDVDFLVGWNKLNWNFNNKVVDYYRACSKGTDHRSLQFTQWHMPEYYSEMPLLKITNSKAITVVVWLPTFDKSQRTTRTTILVEAYLNERANSVIQKAFAKIAKYPDVGSVNDYVLKVIGLKDYLFGETPFISYAHVRKCIHDQTNIELVLVKKPEPIVTPEMKERSEQHIATYEKKVLPDIVPLTPRTYAEVSNVPSFDTIDWKKDIQYIPMSGINAPFQATILGVDKMTSETFPRLSSDITQVFIRTCLFHGNKFLAWSHELPSLDVTGDVLRYNTPLVGGANCLYSVLPREVRVGYVVVGKQREDKEIPLGWVCCQLIDHTGVLLSGKVSHNLWAFPVKEGKKHGKKRDVDPNFMFRATTVDNRGVGIAKAVLTVEYPTFALPVVAPLESPYVEPNPRIVGYQLKEKLDWGQSQLLRTIINADPLHEMNFASKQLLWNCRHYLTDLPSALPKVLQCVPWGLTDFRNEAIRLLKCWKKPTNPIDALELLDVRYANYTVRNYAVQILKSLTDDSLQMYLLQLVQCLKFEPYHDSPLSRFLIERALRNPYQIGHTLYWHLKAELHDALFCERYALILEELLSYVGVFTDELKKQLSVVTKLQKVAEMVVQLKRELQYSDADATKEYHAELEKLNATFFEPMGKFQLPLNPKIECKKLIVEKCRFMSSKMVPLWLVFENADTNTNNTSVSVIFKSGDDLRQDLLTLQLLSVMDRLWFQANLDMRLKPYSVIATGVNDNGEGVGMIEVVMDSDTTSGIQLKYGGGAMGALKLDPLDQYIRAHSSSEAHQLQAVDNFVRSCAGYCVATFVLGIGDRHNGNIMVTKTGHLFHIDFGHFLGNFKKKFGVNRERAAFVFTPEMAYVMGGKDYKKHKYFLEFKNYCTRSFKTLRSNANLIINLFIAMVAAGMPELLKESDILYLRDKLHLDKDSAEANKELQNEIQRSLDSTYRRIDNYIHNIVHG